jgi:cell division transport system permease protein
MADDYDRGDMVVPRGGPGAAYRETPIVPRDSIAGNALSAVVAIMTFLASLTTGAVMLVLSSAADWQSDVARELTIQIRPTANRDLDAEIGKAVEIARAAPGVAEVRPYSKDESARLLEPWLGTGLSLDALPVPRIIVVRTQADQRPDIAALRKALTQQVAGVSLDDHRGWIDRMRAMANTAIAAGFVILVLVLAATVLSVNFATRGAMAANRIIVEVLFLIGAKDHYIASQFQNHFLLLGLKGGAVGGAAALILLALAGLFGNWFTGTAGEEQMAALFGAFSIGFVGYLAVIGQIVLVAAVTALTSRQVVNQTLSTIY